MRKHKIFLDMDDVAKELCKRLVARYNKDFNDNVNWLDNMEQMIWDNKNIKADKKYIMDLLFEKGAFLDNPPIEGFVECVKRLIDDGFEVFFLTFPQWESPYCVSEKVEWLQTYLPFFKLDHLIMAKNKGEVSGKHKILLDDSPNNLTDWEKEGGIGISYAKIKYSQKWCGKQVFSFEEFYEYVHILENAI